MKKLICGFLASVMVMTPVCGAELSAKYNPLTKKYVISGAVPEDSHNGMVGILVTADDDGAIGWTSTVLVDDTGAFKKNIIFKAGSEGGYYTVTIGTSEEGVVKTTPLYYATDEQKVDALSKINEAETTEELDSAITENVLILGINAELYNSLGTAKENVLQIILESEYEEVDDFIIGLETATACALVNNANESSIEGVIDGYSEYFGLDESELYDEFLTVEKQYVYAKMLGADCKNTEDVKVLFEKAVSLTLINNAVKWNEFKTALDTYIDYTGIDKTYYDRCDKNKLAVAICNDDYKTAEELYDAIKKYYNSANTESGSSGGSSGGGGGGGISSAGGLSGGKKENENQTDSDVSAPDNTNEKNLYYSDMSGFSWADDAVNVLTEKGIINGDGTGRFNPSNSITREEFVKILLIASGLFKDGEESSFDDVEKTNWAYPYISCAYSMGIVNGVDDGIFGFGMKITRQDMAVLIERVAKQAGLELEKINEIKFDDIDDVLDYAKESVMNMASAGIINGDGTGKFNPSDEATRAEAAVMVYRLLNR